MTRVTIRHGATLKCQGQIASTDARSTEKIRCPVQFTSYSIVRVIRKQAALAGWGRVPAWHITGSREDGKQLGDACPEHHEIAKVNATRTEELIRTQKEAERAGRAAVRASKKADREQVNAGRVAKWAKTQQEWANARAAKARRKEERTRRQADKAATAARKAGTVATQVKQKAEISVRKKRARATDKTTKQDRASSDREMRIAGAKALVEGPREGS